MLFLIAHLCLPPAALAQDTATPAVRGPARCEAVFDGPVDDCPFAGSWVATGTGPSARKARRNAVSRLQRVVEAVAAQRSQSGAEAAAQAVKSCPEALVREAHITCYPDAGLTDWLLCFGRLEDRQCWRERPVQIEGVVWRAQEQGRDAVCASMDESLQTRGVDDARRLACQVRCLQQAEVSCPR